MLLFSTLLDINEAMTKDTFIELVLEWNQGSPHEDSIIKNIDWNGERNVRFGDDNLWLEIEEYRNQNIIAARYEKKDEDGVVWDTDYVMNFTSMKMAVRLDRSYTEEAMTINPKFSTPHFITLLIERGYIKEDGNLPVLRIPTLINDSNIGILADIINGKTRYRLPIVYISKTCYDENPVNIKTLAERLKGVAHVLVQESNCTNNKLRIMCNSQNEYYGAIGIYYANQAIGHRRYLYRASAGIDTYLLEKVIRVVIQNSNAQLVDTLYTWQGVNNALLRDRLSCQKEERVVAENERRKALYELLELKENLGKAQESMKKEALADAKLEADKILDGFEEDMQDLRNQIARLTRDNEKLVYENIGLKSKLDSNTAVPLLVMGDEDDFYQGEIKDFVLAAVKKELDGTEPKTRKYDVLVDVIQANDYRAIGKQRATEAKHLLSNYSGMTPKIKKGLENIGFVFDASDHQKVKYYGDDRYTIIYASTPSDKGHGGKNNASTTIKKAF